MYNSLLSSMIHVFFCIAKPAMFQSYLSNNSVEILTHSSSFQIRILVNKPFNFFSLRFNGAEVAYMSTQLMVAGTPGRSLFLIVLINLFVAVSSLKISQISDNLLMKFAIVAMNIDNSWMAIAVFFFHFLLLIFKVSSTRGLLVAYS